MAESKVNRLPQNERRVIYSPCWTSHNNEHIMKRKKEKKLTIETMKDVKHLTDCHVKEPYVKVFSIQLLVFGGGRGTIIKLSTPNPVINGMTRITIHYYQIKINTIEPQQ